MRDQSEQMLMLIKQGSFENPLCCPCYLFACCGGLGMEIIISDMPINNTFSLEQHVWNAVLVDFVAQAPKK